MDFCFVGGWTEGGPLLTHGKLRLQIAIHYGGLAVGWLRLWSACEFLPARLNWQALVSSTTTVVSREAHA